jgi:hypothetical protein
MIKYVVYPDYVISKNDGDRHYINSGMLMRLYNVNPKECVVYSRYAVTGQYNGLIPLKVKYNGNYVIPKVKIKDEPIP